MGENLGGEPAPVITKEKFEQLPQAETFKVKEQNAPDPEKAKNGAAKPFSKLLERISLAKENFLRGFRESQ